MYVQKEIYLSNKMPHGENMLYPAVWQFYTRYAGKPTKLYNYHVLLKCMNVSVYL